MKTAICHAVSVGVALAAAAFALAANGGTGPGLAGGLALAAIGVCELAGWLWRQANPPRRAKAPLRPPAPPPIARPVPVREARVGDLLPGEFVRVECGCGRSEVLTAAILATAKVPPQRRMLDLGRRMRCRDCEARGCAVVSVTRGKLA